MKPEKYQLHYLSKSDYPLWDAFVNISPQATIYGKTWYLNALQARFKILAVKKEEAIIGGIVLCQGKRGQYVNPLLAKYLGIYFSTFSGTIYNQETKRRTITKLLLTKLKKLPSFDYLFHPTFSTYLPFHQQNFANQVRYTYWIDLKGQEMETIIAKFHSKLRSEIKFAQKQSYQLVTDLNFDAFFAICQQSFLQKGQNFPFSKSFLQHYYISLSQRKALQLLGIKNGQGQLMAVAGLLIEPQTTSLILSGFDASSIQRGANELLIMECIQLAKQQSAAFDFEGSMLPAIDSFYRKFGGEYVPYLNVYRDSFWRFFLKKVRSNW